MTCSSSSNGIPVDDRALAGATPVELMTGKQSVLHPCAGHIHCMPQGSGSTRSAGSDRVRGDQDSSVGVAPTRQAHVNIACRFGLRGSTAAARTMPISRHAVRSLNANLDVYLQAGLP